MAAKFVAKKFEGAWGATAPALGGGWALARAASPRDSGLGSVEIRYPRSLDARFRFAKATLLSGMTVCKDVYRVNFLYFTLFGSSASGPRRRFLSSS